jgi:hypothetical protein
MSQRGILGGVLALVLVCPGLLSAQHRYAGGGAGVVRPMGSFGDVEKTGWHVFATAMGRLSGVLGFTIDGVFGQMGHQAGIPGHSRVGGVTANLALFFGKEAQRIRPLVMAGAGAYRVNVYVPDVGTGSATEFTWNAGAGLLVSTGSGRQVFIVARYINAGTSPESTSFIPISGGMVFPVGFP